MIRAETPSAMALQQNARAVQPGDVLVVVRAFSPDPVEVMHALTLRQTISMREAATS